MENNPGSQIGLVSARPQFFVEGQEVGRLGSDLLKLVVEETVDGGARCEAVFTNWGPAGGAAGFIYFDR
jgi:hypothetical protein